ncbi:Uncharacterised protein [Mycobacteroides abscessus subsp. abscessus]|nr:Uncharacterised protein [Mycobacteroides abscessus subsp. abscessus]
MILAFSTFETGQPTFALSTAFCTAALSDPGAVTVTSRWAAVMAKPSPTLSSVMVDVVAMFCAVMPALPSSSDSAIEKHAA